MYHHRHLVEAFFAYHSSCSLGMLVGICSRSSSHRNTAPDSLESATNNHRFRPTESGHHQRRHLFPRLLGVFVDGACVADCCRTCFQLGSKLFLPRIEGGFFARGDNDERACFSSQRPLMLHGGISCSRFGCWRIQQGVGRMWNIGTAELSMHLKTRLARQILGRGPPNDDLARL